MPELNVTAHISAPFHVTTKKSNYNEIFYRNLLRELGIQLDFQNNFIGWKDINLPMKPIDCKMTTHFTIQDSNKRRNATKRIKKILDANYKKANLKKGSEHKFELLEGAKSYHAKPFPMFKIHKKLLKQN